MKKSIMPPWQNQGRWEGQGI